MVHTRNMDQQGAKPVHIKITDHHLRQEVICCVIAGYRESTSSSSVDVSS